MLLDRPRVGKLPLSGTPSLLQLAIGKTCCGKGKTTEVRHGGDSRGGGERLMFEASWKNDDRGCLYLRNAAIIRPEQNERLPPPIPPTKCVNESALAITFLASSVSGVRTRLKTQG